MKNNDREFIIEDITFIRSYINTLLDEHPELNDTDAELFIKIERRINDIYKRVGA